jgi:hypothetical protein
MAPTAPRDDPRSGNPAPQPPRGGSAAASDASGAAVVSAREVVDDLPNGIIVKKIPDGAWQSTLRLRHSNASCFQVFVCPENSPKLYSPTGKLRAFKLFLKKATGSSTWYHLQRLSCELLF